MSPSSCRALPCLLAALVLGGSPTLLRAENIVLGLDTAVPGVVEGVSKGPDAPTCGAEILAPPADMPGLSAMLAADGTIHPSVGASMLRLGGSPNAGAEAPALTRWKLSIEAIGASRLKADFNFVPAAGTYFVVTLDGRVLACGDQTAVRFDVSSSIPTTADHPSGWIALAKGADTRMTAGTHLLEITVGRASGSESIGSLYIDNVSVTHQDANPPCFPAPAADVSEDVDMASTLQHWIFDDNKFCADGPFIDCSDPVYGNAGSDFVVDSTNTVHAFEMYVVADCGTVMHIPLADVESGCISVFHETSPGVRDPVAINVNNGAGFNMNGGQVCWTAERCDGGGANDPGGPGNGVTMDVSFQGTPTLCGVYIVEFAHWAGCAWQLYANCNGSTSPQFNIYDSLCDARNAVNLLPEIELENLTVSDGGGCSVNYCVTAHNIGCTSASPFLVRVGDAFDNDNIVVPALGVDATTVLCGNLSATGTGMVPVTVTATSDPNNGLLECSEATGASSCSPRTGPAQLVNVVTIDCSVPPVCNAGGPYQAECNAARGGTHVQLDGSGSNEPGGGTLTYAWTTNCNAATFDNATLVNPVLTLADPACTTCTVSLTVTNTGSISSSCGSTVTVVDTHPPTFVGAPADVTIECGPVPASTPPMVQDECDPSPTMAFAEVTAPGRCPQDYTVTRTWTASDTCGNSSVAAQVITVQDTQPPNIAGSFAACLWPPNHWYVCFSASDMHLAVTDACGPVTFQLLGCASDQPDDAPDGSGSGWNGDGNTTDDCVVSPDFQQVCVRAERCGTGPTAQDGRHYSIVVQAVDACGNMSTGVGGTVHVPHDQSPHERAGCLNPTKVGCRPNQPIPCR